MTRPWLAILVLNLLWAAPAFAVQPDEMLANPALEARAEALGRELRCLVCQNQSIEDSDASLAHDLRVLLRQKLSDGASDADVKNFLVARYGDYILLKPPFKAETLALWLGPLVLLMVALAAAIRFLIQTRTLQGTEPPLVEEERIRLAAVIGESPRPDEQPR
jgi:cytochrome c-type biogenesis protein CcmH